MTHAGLPPNIELNNVNKRLQLNILNLMRRAQFCKESKYVGMGLETIDRELGIENGSS